MTDRLLHLSAYRELQADADELRTLALADFARSRAAIDRLARLSKIGWTVAVVALVAVVLLAVLR